MTGYFVTGTDTNVGKTIVSTTLTLGLSSTYWKPIQTGSIEGTDSDFVRKWSPSGRVAPELYLFEDPISPHLAAENADTCIDLEEIKKQFLDLPKPLIVEGAGGVLVPVSSRHLMIDLIQSLDMPAIIVASAKLGTINHTLLTIEAIRRRAIEIGGVVMIGEERSSPWRTIEDYGGVRVLGHIPFTERFTKEFFHDAFQGLSISPIFIERVLCTTD